MSNSIQVKLNKFFKIKNSQIIDDDYLTYIDPKEREKRIGWFKHDKETRKLISEITKERMKNLGPYLSKKAKEHMKNNPERLERLRRMASKPGKLNGMWGFNWTKELREKLSKATKNQKRYTCVKCGIHTTMGNIKRWGHKI